MTSVPSGPDTTPAPDGVLWGVRVGKSWEGIGVVPMSEADARAEARRAPTLHLVRSVAGGSWEDVAWTPDPIPAARPVAAVDGSARVLAPTGDPETVALATAATAAHQCVDLVTSDGSVALYLDPAGPPPADVAAAMAATGLLPAGWTASPSVSQSNVLFLFRERAATVPPAVGPTAPATVPFGPAEVTALNHLAGLVRSHQDSHGTPDAPADLTVCWEPAGWWVSVVCPGHHAFEQEGEPDLGVLLAAAVRTYSGTYSYDGGCPLAHPPAGAGESR